MPVTSKRTKHLHILPASITIGNAQIPFKQSVKNLGFTLDYNFTMNAHVSNNARTCYFELRRLASIRRFLTSTATATLVSAFVSSRIDYCNSLLFCSTHDPNGSCLFMAGSPTDTVSSQNFRAFSAHQLAFLVTEQPMPAMLLRHSASVCQQY